MNLVDSSGWLEYLTNGKNAQYFSSPLTEKKKLLVPSICIYEVFKRVLLDASEGDAVTTIAMMHQGEVVELNATLAIEAAKLSVDLKIPMADSIIVATARKYNAVIWTQDAHFKNLPNVKFIDK